MICKKCKEIISEVFAFCPFCGRPVVPVKRKASKRHNGAGSITKRAGNHDRPFIARLTVAGSQIYLGTYKTRDDAQMAIDELATKPKNDKFNVSVEDIYNEWSAAYFVTLSKSGKDGYTAAWARLSSIKDKKMREVRAADIQTVIDGAVISKKDKATGKKTAAPLSQSGKEKILQLASQLCKKAMEYDVIDKNYADFVVLKRDSKSDKEIFTDLEIAKLRKDDSETSRIILTLIYTGMRINELFTMRTADVHLAEGYMVGGEKTAAGRNRTIPISPLIRPYIVEWVNNGHDLLVVNSAGGQVSDDNFRKRQYYPKLDDLDIPRKNPHTTRHTFATIARRCGVREEVLSRILGHTSFSMTDHYITKDLGDLTQAVTLIK